MDLGATNILGQKTPLTDPLVKELIRRIEAVVAGGADKSTLEIEGRIGKLCMGGPKRLFLPMATEVVLPPSGSRVGQNGKPFRFEFVSNLEKPAFEGILQRLEKLLDMSSAVQKYPIMKVIGKRSSHTIDEIYKSPFPVRLSFNFDDYSSGGSPVEILSKESVEKIDVWSGNYGDVIDEMGGEESIESNHHPMDYRLAVNTEKKLPLEFFHQVNRADCVMKREKKRTTFDMKAWVVDMTVVTVLGSASTLEIEAELKSPLLFEQLERRKLGKVHGAYQIVNDFITFLRDLCYVFGGAMSDTTNADAKYPDLSECEPSDDKKRKYKETTGTDVFPILGDYIFNILTELKPRPVG